MTTAAKDRAHRIATTWDYNPNLSEAEVVDLVDTELAAEAEQEAEREARAQTFVDSVSRLWSCRACGGTAMPGSRDAYCETCRRAAYVLAGLASLDDKIGKQTRRQLIEADLAARQQEAG